LCAASGALQAALECAQLFACVAGGIEIGIGVEVALALKPIPWGRFPRIPMEVAQKGSLTVTMQQATVALSASS